MTNQTILTPAQGMAHYLNDIRLTHPEDGRIVVNPVLFATVFFESGATPEVRQALLDCFDAFEARFGKHLRGGILAGNGGKYSAKTAKGVEAIRQRILTAKPYECVEFVRSDVTDQYTAPDYAIRTMTCQQFPDGGDGGMQSYLKFVLPWSLAVDAEITQYHDFLHLICRTLPIRGDYGGLTPALPRGYHNYQPQEYELAMRFSGLEIDSTAYSETETYRIQSVDGEEPDITLYNYLKPGAEITGIGHIKSVNWYTILGDVFVERLGGEEALRKQLARADIGVTREGQCLLIRAGDFPRLGAPEEGLIEPYAFVNRAVRGLRDPKHDDLHTYIPDTERADEDNTLRWLARFDLPEDGPVVPWAPKSC